MILFVDSADAGAAAIPKWDLSSAGMAPSSSWGRQGTRGYRFAGGAFVVKNLGNQFNQLYVGLACKVVTGHDSNFLAFQDAGSVQTAVRILPDGSIRIMRGPTSIALSTAQIPLNAYGYLEVFVSIANGTGQVTVRWNNAVVFDVTAVDTADTANAYITQYKIGGGSGDFYGDDFYIADTSGTEFNDFLGDLHIEATFPTGAGSRTELTIGGSSPAATNWQGVDEQDANGDVDFNSGDAVGEGDLYAFGDLTSGDGQVLLVAVNEYIRKEEGGNRQSQAVIKVAGVQALGLAHTLSTDYDNYQTLFTVDSSAVGWTPSSFNGAEFGSQVAV